MDVDAALDAANLASLLGLDIPDIIDLDLVDVTAGLDADATGNGNNNFAIGALNTALTAFGNHNNNIAGGALNQAVTVGTPGIEAFLKAVALGAPVLDATLGLEPTGNNNNNIGLGLGNTAATVLGNNNNNVAAGLVNQAITVGTPGIDLLGQAVRC